MSECMRRDAGHLFVQTHLVTHDAEWCNKQPFVTQPGDFCEIVFQDTGCGIPVENMERVFEPFFSTKGQERGNGLGLVAVWNSAQSHYGAVEVYSEENTGTTFRLSLPLYVGGHSSDEMRPVSELNCDWHVLVVDDEPVVRMAAKALLESFGCSFVLAKHGGQAIYMVEQNREQFDLILLDMKMPILFGERAFYQLRDMGADTPVVLCTGFTGDAKVSEMQRNGLAGIIEKPFRRNDFAQSIKGIMDRRHGRSGRSTDPRIVQ